MWGVPNWNPIEINLICQSYWYSKESQKNTAKKIRAKSRIKSTRINNELHLSPALIRKRFERKTSTWWTKQQILYLVHTEQLQAADRYFSLQFSSARLMNWILRQHTTTVDSHNRWLKSVNSNSYLGVVLIDGVSCVEFQQLIIHSTILFPTAV